MTKAEYMREWKKKNPERVREINRRYRERNREKAREAARNWRARNLLRSRDAALRWAKANPEAHKASSTRWRQLHPDRARANWRRSDLKNKYGITLAEYDALLQAQNGRCAVCETKPTQKILHVDHDHVTGELRGLLCSACNTALGLLNDDPKRIRALAAYVAQYKLEAAG
jgi:Recombination endonuclease VII